MSNAAGSEVHAVEARRDDDTQDEHGAAGESADEDKDMVRSLL